MDFAHAERKARAQEACKRLYDSGTMHYNEIAAAADVGYSSLRTFVHNGNLGPEPTQKLYNWLEDHGHLPTSPSVAETPTSERAQGGDVLDETLEAIMVIVRNLKNPTRDRATKARIALKQLEVIHGELGAELHELGKSG